MLRQFETAIISYKLKSLSAMVDYYKNAYLPDLYHYTGRSKQDCLESAIEELERFQTDVKDYNINRDFDVLDIPPYEKANYIRAYLIELYNEATDFSSNPYIWVRNLRNCILLKQEILKLYPQLEVYSNLAFRNPNIIFKLG